MCRMTKLEQRMCRRGAVTRFADISNGYKQFRVIEPKPSGSSTSDKNVVTIKRRLQA